MDISLAGAILILFALIFYGVNKLAAKRRPKKIVLKRGDYVMFKRSYKNQYPAVPTSHAMVIEKITDGKATVVFMNTQNEVLKETLPLDAIVKAS